MDHAQARLIDSGYGLHDALRKFGIDFGPGEEAFNSRRVKPHGNHSYVGTRHGLSRVDGRLVNELLHHRAGIGAFGGVRVLAFQIDLHGECARRGGTSGIGFSGTGLVLLRRRRD